MLLLYKAGDVGATILFLVLGTWALFYLPQEGRRGLSRKATPQARRLFFRAVGCAFCTWGWARAFEALLRHR
jgi:hypothetical protein